MDTVLNLDLYIRLKSSETPHTLISDTKCPDSKELGCFFKVIKFLKSYWDVFQISNINQPLRYKNIRHILIPFTSNFLNEVVR